MGGSLYPSPRDERAKSTLAPTGTVHRLKAETGDVNDVELVESLRKGDEEAFRRLIDEQSPALLRVAIGYVGSRATAEDVLQETWVGVLRGVDRFEGRSSLRTWIFRILTNTAKTRAARESRAVPFSSLAGDHGSGEGPVVDPDRFLPADHASEPGHWALAPRRWDTPEEGLLSGEIREVILAAIDSLPPSQRIVVSLRDIEGWPADEVCEVLELSEGNQRVLLHRGRSKVRGELERYFEAAERTLPEGD
jgi:RNA polymerase sigma-70 factor (ECF subfamily)